VNAGILLERRSETAATGLTLCVTVALARLINKRTFRLPLQ